MGRDILQFKKIELTDLSKIQTIVTATRYRSCQLSSGGLYCLSEKYDTKICFRNGFMFVRQHRRGFGLCYFMPVGTGNLSSAIATLFEHHSENEDGNLIIWGIADDMIDDFRNVVGEVALDLRQDRDWAEYIYSSDKLLTLSGKRLQPKRNAANQFVRNHSGYICEPIALSNKDEVLQFQQQQFATDYRSETDVAWRELLKEEHRAIEITLTDWESSVLTGVIIRIDGAIKAFAIGCPVNGDTFDIMFESAERTYNGIFQVLEQELIRNLPSSFLYINREEDLGIPGLRFAKQSLRPDILLMKYSATISFISTGKQDDH